MPHRLPSADSGKWAARHRNMSDSDNTRRFSWDGVTPAADAPSSASFRSTPTDDSAGLPTTLGLRLTEGLHFLQEAHDLAVDVGVDVWEFALDLRELRSVGLTNSDLRWMVLKGYLQPGCETTLPGEPQRSFRPIQGLIFAKRTCFVLTPAGVEAARSTGAHSERGGDAATLRPTTSGDRPPAPRVVPHWDADLQELRVNGLIVKQFKVPAPNQEMVLAAFEEEHWPARIDDPLPPQAEQDPKRRLHDTIVSLNRNHKHRMLRFMGDGSGEGVRWTIVTTTDDAPE